MTHRTRPRTSCHPAGRTLHVIDIQNLVGGSDAGPTAVGPALSAYRRTVRVAAGDHAFAGLAWALRARGVAVMTVARDRESLSADVRRAAMHRTLALAS